MRTARGWGALVGLALAAACGAPSPSAMPLPHDLLVTTTAHRLDGPDSVAAGWTRLRYHLDSADAGHNLVLFALAPLDDSITFVAALDTMHATARPGTALGGHEGAGAVGDTASAWLHLAPGRYLLACLTRDSAGHRHATTGERRWVDVVASADSLGAPAATVTLAMSDYAYGAVPAWPAGPQTLRIVNNGHEDHLVLIERLHPGVTFQEWIYDEHGTRSEHLGGMTRLGAGREFHLELDLPAGEYMVLCLVPDGPSGKSHLELGMMRQFTVGSSPGGARP